MNHIVQKEYNCACLLFALKVFPHSFFHRELKKSLLKD